MLLEGVSLSGTGRPLLLPSEVEQAQLDPVDLCFEGAGGRPGAEASEYKAFRCQLTTHRLLWISENHPDRCCALHLQNVHSLRVKTKLISSTSLLVFVSVDASNFPVPTGETTVAKIGELKLRYGGYYGSQTSKVEEFKGHVHRMLEQKAWQRDVATVAPGAQADPTLLAQVQAMGFPTSRAALALVNTGNTGAQQAINWLLENPDGAAGDTPGEPEPSSARPTATTGAELMAMGAGISGILRRQQEQAAEADSTLKEAFADLKNLEQKARDVVELAERFRSTLSRKGDGMGGDAAQLAMEEELISMGITSPVTKETAGRSYYKELSRQLSDFLLKPLDKAGGMMTMQEVYCLFNRARGTELLSPDDLIEAVAQFKAINSPLLLRNFDSGVKVVCSASLDYDKVCAELLRLVKPDGTDGLGLGITERDAASRLGVSLLVAREYVLTAERRGVLCRDDSPEGLRFFRNFFPEATTTASAA